MKHASRWVASTALALCVAATPAFAGGGGGEGALDWSWQALPADGGDAQVVDIVLSADIQPGWIVYASDFQAPEFGPRPAKLTLEADPSYGAEGAVQAVGAQRGSGKNPAGEYAYSYFSGQAQFRQRVRYQKDAKIVSGTLSGQSCQEETGLCTLFRKKFTVVL